MTTSEQKILDAIKARPGLLWYEVGAIVYPACTKARINLQGKLFRELTGRGLSLTYDAITSLEKSGAIQADKEHRYCAVARERKSRKAGAGK